MGVGGRGGKKNKLGRGGWVGRGKTKVPILQSEN